ncbi:MAG TPA: WecB/TagA/CpsF family glycosyltransferase [Verrucomicrobiae bacterium]|jgi:exopolysaccharide biosynthesis WecB/TagA/CpsF family protein|nr:WecB/TagA/CpsF family glycosyltransferase [Verrucomicrobiae bacterium]
MKILLIGHACSPRQGSEASFTWNWALHLSRRHEVYVLAHPHDRDTVERFLADNQNSNLEFHWVAVPRWLDPWNPRGTDKGLRLHYLFWLRRAYKTAVGLRRRIAFDIVHHVSYGSLSAPPPFWKLPIPFIWGPIGGAQQAPRPFRRFFGLGWPREFLRNARVGFLPHSPYLGRAARASAALLATNHDTAKVLAQIGGRDVRLFLDSGLSSNFVFRDPISRPDDGSLTLLWVGRMQPRKALPLALEALARTKDLRVKLLIAGDGEMRKPWERYAERLDIGSRVEFLGRLPWQEMPRLYQSADAFLFTSLQDSFGTQVLEAMGHGLPILTLDHQGVASFVPPEAGIKVPVTAPEQTLQGLAEGIRRLALFPAERRKMGDAAHAYAKTQTWDKRAECLSNLYEEVLSRPVRHEGIRRSIAAPWEYPAPGNLSRSVCSALARTAHSPENAPNEPVHRRFKCATFNVLGVRTHAVQIGKVVERMQEWIHERDGCRSVAAADMHCIVEAQRNSSFKDILNAADLVVPDGMPLVWLGRHQGYFLRRRVYGPDLLLAFCEESAGRRYRHFFCGGEPGVAERLAESLKCRFPELNVVGTCSPPFRTLNADEDAGIVEMINRAAPDVLWVGLGAPKQERWIHEHKDRLRVPVAVGIGAAFDLLSGRRRQAPSWMREHGLEWFFRLLQEPRRLWRRYLVCGPQFLAYVVLDSLRVKNFEASSSRLPRRARGHQGRV